MLGSTIIHTTDPKLLLCEDLEELLYQEGISYIELDRLITLDFTIFVDSDDVSWNEPGDPVRLDEEAGLAIVKISPAGLQAFLSGHHDLDPAQQRDKERLREFTERFGPDNLYEWASF